MVSNSNVNNSNFMFTNFKGLLEIKKRIDDLELPNNIKGGYMSFRYNCDTEGKFIFLFENNVINENDIKN